MKSVNEMRFPNNLHITIKEYRVLGTGMIMFSSYITFNMWDWFKDNHTLLTLESAGAFTAFAGLIVGLTKLAYDNLSKKHEADD